ncbi:GPW/gp25 family protein [Peptoniphilus asaccharolyticus]|nr:MAG TPA: Baseplate wedge protein [Caudoviricetes sp.]DAS83442.1 MAG TPA: Baseplate wedge protein [Caudoviricetes sp.]DAY41546.1 MAG TPA: Baseplate wedge protein [Caudoviricetes sp.]
MNNEVQIYSDLDQSLNSEYVYNVNAIKQSIKNILSTRKGTRIFNAEFGSDIHKYLFEIMDDHTSFALMNEIVIAVGRWEPRVTIEVGLSGVTADYQNGIYWVNIVFRIKSNPSELHNFEIGITR